MLVAAGPVVAQPGTGAAWPGSRQLAFRDRRACVRRGTVADVEVITDTSYRVPAHLTVPAGRRRSPRFAKLVAQAPPPSEHLAPSEAVRRVKALATAKFGESVEMHARLNLQPKYPDQQLRTTVQLPHGTGKTIRVAVLCSKEDAEACLAAGASLAGPEAVVEALSGGQLPFQRLLCTPALLPRLAPFGRLLGPRGLMPSSRAGTLVQRPAESVALALQGQQAMRLDRSGNVHLSLGRAAFAEDQLLGNFLAACQAVDRARPSGAKGALWRSLHLAPSMGPSVRVDVRGMLDAVRSLS